MGCQKGGKIIDKKCQNVGQMGLEKRGQKIGAVLQKSSKFQTCSMAKLSVSIVQVCSPDGATKV